MNLYQSCKISIRVSYFGFVLLAIGYLIQNKNVNIFYTFQSNVILFIGELFLKVGEIIIMNLPLIFMLNIVCKKANNASPIIMALVGYFTYIVTTMLFANQSLDAYAYASGYGINSIFNINVGSRLPLETGMIASLLVGFSTRLSFVLSRHRTNYSLTNIVSKEAAGIIYNTLICFLIGIIVSYGYPFIYKRIATTILFISEDLLDPLRIGIYSVLDRILSILGLSNIIRYPFWFGSLGGSYSNVVTGQSILGDVSIWEYVKGTDATFVGAGRFITPYYVVNMFIIPAIYLGTLLSMSDTNERKSCVILFIGGILLSIICGNPVPIELLMIFTSPLLFGMYLLLVGIVSGSLVGLESFVGFSSNVTNTNIAMPGCFADFIINIRDTTMSHSIIVLLMVGLVSFVVALLITIVYYRVLAYDFIKTGKSEKLVKDIIESVGGRSNIDKVGSGLFKLNLYLINPEGISIEKVQELGPKKVIETRDGISFEFGVSSLILSNLINDSLKNVKPLNKPLNIDKN